MIYLDCNATTPVHPEVLEAMLPYYREKFGNASSIHWGGRQVKGAVEDARERVASLVNCSPGEVVFTASGSEADNTAIKGVADALGSKGNHIITTRVEHPAVLGACRHLEQRGFDITWVDVDRSGQPDLAHLEESIGDRTILITAMFANNETGTLFPVRRIGAIARAHGIYFHCDAVQAVGRVPVDCREDNIQLLALSGHKIYAPKGVGALVVRKGVKMSPLIHGGAQERHRRAGTENVAGIVAFGKACELAEKSMTQEADRQRRLRDRLEEGIMGSIAGVTVNGDREWRLPNTANLSFAGVGADSLLVSLDLEGIAASSGAACSSGTLRTSHVLAAMGLSPEEAKGSIRFSLGSETTEEEVARVVEVLPALVTRLRASA